MTVAELRERVSNAEYVRWCAWFALKAQREELASRGGGGRG